MTEKTTLNDQDFLTIARWMDDSPVPYSAAQYWKAWESPEYRDKIAGTETERRRFIRDHPHRSGLTVKEKCQISYNYLLPLIVAVIAGLIYLVVDLEHPDIFLAITIITLLVSLYYAYVRTDTKKNVEVFNYTEAEKRVRENIDRSTMILSNLRQKYPSLNNGNDQQKMYNRPDIHKKKLRAESRLYSLVEGSLSTTRGMHEKESRILIEEVSDLAVSLLSLPEGGHVGDYGVVEHPTLPLN